MSFIHPNILSNEELQYLNNHPEVSKAKSSLDSTPSGMVYFSVRLTDVIRSSLESRFGLDLSGHSQLPMRWIKGDTEPHVDVGHTDFKNTYLIYLNDSPGELLIDSQSFPIQSNTGFVFNEGLPHETLSTGNVARLLIGPMNEFAEPVGAAPTNTNYVQGSVDNNSYNLLISGASYGYTSSGVMLGGDTETTYGIKISNDSSNNAFMDLRGDASNKISFRHKDHSSGSVTSMLELMNDSALTGNGYGATVNGRMNASSYYVGQIDTRTPSNPGVYMGTDGNVGTFSINKGSGTGGFKFSTYNSNGSLLQNNLNLLSSGVIQAQYYTATNHSEDIDDVAVMGLDASGNLVRNYATNARFRTAESRLTAFENGVVVPNKINEIVTRLNGLGFFSQSISTLTVSSGGGGAPPAPSALYSFTTFTFTPNGAIGHNGPTSLTYNTTTYPWVTQYITLSNGIQQWTVPKTANYNLIAAGAGGGNYGSGGYAGSSGIIVANTVSLTKNDTIYILVGQKGVNGGSGGGTTSMSGGGGGGTFIVKYLGGATNSSSSYQILLIAGGGGGGGAGVAGTNAIATTTANGCNGVAAASGGNGGGGLTNDRNEYYPGAGGFLTNGVQSSPVGGQPNQEAGGYSGLSFLNGGIGGAGNVWSTGSPFYSFGGFGGGAAGGITGAWGAGGGGGYSGGGSCGFGHIFGEGNGIGGGGGGSYDINGSSNNATGTGFNSGDGYATISESS